MSYTSIPVGYFRPFLDDVSGKPIYSHGGDAGVWDLDHAQKIRTYTHLSSVWKSKGFGKVLLGISYIFMCTFVLWIPGYFLYQKAFSIMNGDESQKMMKAAKKQLVKDLDERIEIVFKGKIYGCKGGRPEKEVEKLLVALGEAGYSDVQLYTLLVSCSKDSLDAGKTIAERTISFRASSSAPLYQRIDRMGIPLSFSRTGGSEQELCAYSLADVDLYNVVTIDGEPSNCKIRTSFRRALVVHDARVCDTLKTNVCEIHVPYTYHMSSQTYTIEPVALDINLRPVLSHPSPALPTIDPARKTAVDEVS